MLIGHNMQINGLETTFLMRHKHLVNKNGVAIIVIHSLFTGLWVHSQTSHDTLTVMFGQRGIFLVQGIIMVKCC